MLTPGRIAPLVSVTLPAIDPVCACANASDDPTSTAIPANKIRRTIVMPPPA
jgi:hypothetical protein